MWSSNSVGMINPVPTLCEPPQLIHNCFMLLWQLEDCNLRLLMEKLIAILLLTPGAWTVGDLKLDFQIRMEMQGCVCCLFPTLCEPTQFFLFKQMAHFRVFFTDLMLLLNWDDCNIWCCSWTSWFQLHYWLSKGLEIDQSWQWVTWTLIFRIPLKWRCQMPVHHSLWAYFHHSAEYSCWLHAPLELGWLQNLIAIAAWPSKGWRWTPQGQCVTWCWNLGSLEVPGQSS